MCEFDIFLVYLLFSIYCLFSGDELAQSKGSTEINIGLGAIGDKSYSKRESFKAYP